MGCEHDNNESRVEELRVLPLTPEQQKLANSHVNWAIARAIYWASKYGLHKNDVKSAAFEGLVIAACKYDCTRGIKFSTYSKEWIDEYCRRCVRDLRGLYCKRKTVDKKVVSAEWVPKVKLVSLDQPIDDGLTWHEIIPSEFTEEPEVPTPRLHKLYSEMCASLRENERAVLLDHVLNEMSFRELGEKFGFSRARAGQLAVNATRKLRERFATEAAEFL